MRQYRQMYDAYFDQRSLIPAGRLHEISFEALESDPLGQLRDIYAALDLPDFARFEPELRAYLETLHGYQKNRLPELSPAVRQRLYHDWTPCFDRWGYGLGD